MIAYGTSLCHLTPRTGWLNPYQAIELIRYKKKVLKKSAPFIWLLNDTH